MHAYIIQADMNDLMFLGFIYTMHACILIFVKMED